MRTPISFPARAANSVRIARPATSMPPRRWPPRRSWSPGGRTPRPPPPYGWAVLTAALDVARLGARARLPARGRSGLLY